MMSLNPLRLSIVVVCKNESRNIARCLTSVVSASRLVDDGVEVIVADSASTDRTVEIALGFPVRVVHLEASWPLAPAAGRFHGGLAARGDYVLFIDGDMALDAGFLPAALRRLDGDETLAGVTGVERQVFLEDGATVGGRENTYDVPPVEAPARVLPGAALFRRDALVAVGGFDPFLSSEEEADLCYRLTQAGHALVTLPIPIVDHYSGRRRSFAELRRRMRGRLYRGIGQVLRRSIDRGLFFQHAWRLRVFLGFALFLLCGVIALLAWPLAQSPRYLVLWLAALTAIFALLAARKHSPGEAALSIVVLAAIVWETGAGFSATLPPAVTYPREARTTRSDSFSA